MGLSGQPQATNAARFWSNPMDIESIMGAVRTSDGLLALAIIAGVYLYREVRRLESAGLEDVRKFAAALQENAKTFDRVINTLTRGDS